VNARNEVQPLAPDRPLSDLINAEQIDMLYRQSPTSIVGNMTGALVLAGAFYSQRPTWLIASWVGCMAVLQISRLILYLRYRRNGLRQSDVSRAFVTWTAGAGVTGLLYGSTAVLFFMSGHDLYQALLTVLIFGITASAIPLIGCYIPSFYMFTFPALIPFVARNLYEGDTPHLVLGLIEAAVMLGFASFARDYNRMLTESLRNRLEKQALADQLAAQNVALDQARIVSEQANRSKTQFFAAASHDLRQPLHAMGLFASALTEQVREPRAAAVVTSINASVQALESLFNELLEISKLDSGIIKPHVVQFPLSRVFDRLRSEFAAEAAAKHVDLRVDQVNAIVSSDPVLLDRIMRNLISNAIRYTLRGQIAVTAEPCPAALRISVRDTGIGIRPEDQQRIYDEFMQLGNPGRTSKKGLGLGLSIVQRLASLLGYAIELQSHPGEGSTFSFEVPLSSGQALPEHAPKADANSRADLGGMLIVVIDDESAIVEGMTVLLTGWGAEVIGLTSGEGALDAVYAAGKIPALLIVDHRLGTNEDGIALAQRLRRELDPEIPALLVSGSITPELAEQARIAGLDFLLKPVTADKFQKAIQAALRLHEAQAG